MIGDSGPENNGVRPEDPRNRLPQEQDPRVLHQPQKGSLYPLFQDINLEGANEQCAATIFEALNHGVGRKSRMRGA